VTERSVLHLVRAQRSALPAPGDTLVAVDSEGRFHAPPAAGRPPGPVDAADVVTMLFESDVVVVW